METTSALPRRRLGRAVAVAGLGLLALTAAGCGGIPTSAVAHIGSTTTAPVYLAALDSASAKTRWPTKRPPLELEEAGRENEEVVPVNAVSTWVLPSRVTVGR